MVPDIATFPLTPTDIRRALWRYRGRAALFFAAVCGLTLAGSLVMPRSYVSEAKIFVRFGRENLAVDPTANATGTTIAVNESRESEINSLLEVLRSRALLDQTVERIGAENLLRGMTPDHENAAETFVASTEPNFGQAHQRAIQLLERNVFVQTPRKSNVISVGSKAATPELAQRIVSDLVDLYLREHTRVNSTAGSFDFFEDRTNSLRKQWQAALEALRSAKDRYEIVTVEGKRQTLESRIAAIENLQATNAADLAQSHARSASLTKLLDATPQTLVTDTAGFPNAPDDNFRSGVNQLELKAGEMFSRYNDSHPLAKLMKMQLEESRRSMTSVEEGRVQTTKAEHPTRMALELSLFNEHANEEALAARGKSLAAESAAIITELRDLNAHEVEIAGLTQTADLTGRQFRESAEKLEQARVSRELDQDGISNLRLVQPASFNPKPKGVGRTQVCGLGAFVGLLGGLGLALISAWLNPQLMTAGELQSLLKLPVAATVRRRGLVVAATDSPTEALSA